MPTTFNPIYYTLYYIKYYVDCYMVTWIHEKTKSYYLNKMHYILDTFSKDIYGLTYCNLPSNLNHGYLLDNCGLNPDVSAHYIVNKRVFICTHKSCKTPLTLSTTEEYKYTSTSILNTFDRGKILSRILLTLCIHFIF